MTKEALIEMEGIVNEVLPDELTPYDLTKGRINFRHKDETPAVRLPPRRPQYRRR